MGNEANWAEALVKTVSGSLGLKVGPGVLLVVGWVMAIGFSAAAVSVWALQSNPFLALSVAVLILIVAAYFSERAFRYAEKNPIPALMGGAELLKVIEHQMGAKDKSIVDGKQLPQAGASVEALQSPSAPPMQGGGQ